MDRRARINLAYFVFAVVAMALLQQWWQRAQSVEVVPCSEFEKLLSEKKIDEVIVSDQRVIGKLKAPQGKVMSILTRQRAVLERGAQRLLEKETLAEDELEEFRHAVKPA